MVRSQLECFRKKYLGLVRTCYAQCLAGMAFSNALLGIVHSMAHKTGAENRWNITLTQEEIDLLAKIVWLESQGEPTEGQEAVVEVVFNRMASEKYPDTLYDVLSQGNPTQFCSWKNRERANPTEKEYTSIHEVLNGNTHILRNDTLYFSTEPLTPRLDQKIGGHSFCY